MSSRGHLIHIAALLSVLSIAHTASPIFVGATGAPATDRLEPRLMLGAQFANSGWGLTSSTMPAGGYRLVVFALSTVTGQFDAEVVT